MTPDEEYAFYADPANQDPQGVVLPADQPPWEHIQQAALAALQSLYKADPFPEAAEGHLVYPATWLVAGRWNRLHGPAGRLSDEQAHMLFDGGADDVAMLCGRVMSGVVVPGVFTRMGGQRCAQCCDRRGWPRGVGSPHNAKLLDRERA